MRGPSEEILIHVEATLRDATGSDVAPLVASLSRSLGVTPQTIYRWAHTKGLRWRKSPATKGTSRINRETVTEAAAIVHASRRRSNQATIPACDAVEILSDSGREIDVSPSWFRARMRQEQLSTRDLLAPSPHVTMLSEHPNHVWQFDVTNCIQYFLDDKKGMGERDPDMELYQNKIVKTAKSIRKELLRYAVVDHCTGAFYFRYFYASGERASDGAQFLFEAMRPKDEIIKSLWNGDSESRSGKYRFHGVPYLLVADRGSIMTSKANQNLFASLKIDLRTHLPGNPRAKGGIEWLMKNINRFEGRLKFERPRDLADINRKAMDWCITYCAVKDMRGIAPRSALWGLITKAQLRLCPDEALYWTLRREPTLKAKANGGCIIRVDGRFYKIPDTNAAHRWIIVTRNAYEFPRVDAHFNDHIWLLSPIPLDQFGRLTSGVPYGQYRSPAQTETQKAKTEIEKIAEGWGLSWKGTGDHRIAVAPPVGHISPLTVFGRQTEKLGNLELMDRKGTPLEVAPPEPIPNKPVLHSAHEVSRAGLSRMMPLIDFMRQLKDEIGPIPPDLNRILKDQYPDGVPVDDARDLTNSFIASLGFNGSNSLNRPVAYGTLNGSNGLNVAAGD
jgi:hypothetical protein